LDIIFEENEWEIINLEEDIESICMIFQISPFKILFAQGNGNSCVLNYLNSKSDELEGFDCRNSNNQAIFKGKLYYQNVENQSSCTIGKKSLINYKF